ncbi:methylmalonyl-CoA/ethylmalonyl-CoA epimerase [Allocatelliglobosispora scoriae]|uniref:Methylmalonyl-CoA/ethylmalonyl-CoA epimerase n=2 Tax=Allocatelliglobosispora scoriae TaxID=643052 RepID=A0A841C4C8_9ACTN|nr:methylmalonyl-CoA/ethylmalonyl-CoA epimerase [Allocatelliglobosispora scoriae]
MVKFDEGIAETYGVDCQFWGVGAEPGAAAIELVAPNRDDAAIHGHLRRSGAGLYHVAFEVDDIDAELRRLRDGGATPVDRGPCAGARAGMRVCFVYLGTATGLLVELVQYDA